MRRAPAVSNDTSKISQFRQVGKRKLRTKQKLGATAQRPASVSADRTFGR
jgi:hypothetical protein